MFFNPENPGIWAPAFPGFGIEKTVAIPGLQSKHVKSHLITYKFAIGSDNRRRADGFTRHALFPCSNIGKTTELIT